MKFQIHLVKHTNGVPMTIYSYAHSDCEGWHDALESALGVSKDPGAYDEIRLAAHAHNTLFDDNADKQEIAALRKVLSQKDETVEAVMVRNKLLHDETQSLIKQLNASNDHWAELMGRINIKTPHRYLYQKQGMNDVICQTRNGTFLFEDWTETPLYK